MATTPPSIPPAPKADPRDDAFIREVDEAYREDAMRNFVKTWGRWILLGIGLLLAALGAWFWWQAESERRIDAQSEQFSEALGQIDSGATTEAMQALDTLVETGNDSYRASALMTQAGIATAGGDTEKGAGLLRAVADDAKVAEPMRDVAKMKLVRLEFDKLQPADILQRLEPYLVGDSPWFPIAGEMAALAHLKAGAPDKAGPIFYRIAGDERAPTSLRARAEQMAAMLGQDVTKLAAEAEAREKAAAPTAPAEAPAQ